VKFQPIRRRPGGQLWLLYLAVALLLVGGSWFAFVRFPAVRDLGRQALTTAERLLEDGRALANRLAGFARRKAPRLSAWLGLVEPPLPPEMPQEAPPEPAPPPRRKTPAELRVESIVESTYREYFKDFTIRGRRMTVRMPFALNEERESSRGFSQDFYFDGKGTPARLWPYIGSVLSSKAFAAYAARVEAPGEKVVVFNLPRRAYRVTTNRLLLNLLKRGFYPGTLTRIFVHKPDGGLNEAAVYNYLYAGASVGVDCSGCSYHVLENIARAHELELDRVLGRKLRVDPRQTRMRVGLWFFDPERGYTQRVPDRIEELRPGDLLLFRGSDGRFKHSAVIQSIDVEDGVLRYVQSTDWAGETDRGVHLSALHFDPTRANVGLAHYSVRWLQQVRPPFAGEKEPRNWQTDGDRYLWYTEEGGSMVVRLRVLASALVMAEHQYYKLTASER